jgi:hypothetical protein
MRDIGKRIAAEGYSVLVPNPFYRMGKVATLDLNTASFSFQNKDDMTKLQKLMGGITAAGAAEKDAVAFIAFLDAQWAARWFSGPPQPFPTELAPAPRSMAAVWSPTGPTARTCSSPR